MKYIELINRFCGINQRWNPAKLGEVYARDCDGVDLEDGTLRNRRADVIDTTHATPGVQYVSMYDWNGTLIADENDVYTYHEYGSRLLRAGMPIAGKRIQYARVPSPLHWDVLGLAPPDKCSAAAGAAGTLTGDYTYYVVMGNAFGDLSAPSEGATVTLAAQQGALTNIPLGYAKGNVTNGSASVTGISASDITRLREGMRVVTPGGQIPADTFITAVGSTSVTLSNQATGTAASVWIQDAQVDRRVIYRQGGALVFGHVVAIISDVTTTTYNDNTSDAALGAAADVARYGEVGDELRTEYNELLPVLGGITIRPDGALFGIGETASADKRVFFTDSRTDATHFYYRGNYLDILDRGAACFYGLDRVFVFTEQRLHYILGTDVTNLGLYEVQAAAPILTADHHPRPVLMDGEVWFWGRKGMFATDGYRVRQVMEQFWPRLGDGMVVPIGAARSGGRYYAMVSLLVDAAPTYDHRIFTYDPTLTPESANPAGWTSRTITSPGSLIFAPTVALDNILASFNSRTVALEAHVNASGLPVDDRTSGGRYITGSLAGKGITQLSTYRKIRAVFDGDMTVTATITDDTGTPNVQLVSFNRTSLGRSDAWLEPGTRGRTIQLDIQLTSADSVLHEVGVLVAETKELL